MKVHRMKSYRRNLLKNNLVISVGRVLIQISIKKSLATLNIKMLKRLSQFDERAPERVSTF